MPPLLGRTWASRERAIVTSDFVGEADDIVGPMLRGYGLSDAGCFRVGADHQARHPDAAPMGGQLGGR